MKSFAVKEKRSTPVACNRSQPSRFGYRSPVARAQQNEIHNILRSTGAQAKLSIGQPNDKYEQEADRVADQVMSMSDADVVRRVEAGTIQPMQVQRMCAPCSQEYNTAQNEGRAVNPVSRCPKCRQGTSIQTKESPGQTPQVSSETESRIHSLKAGGQSLDLATRSFFEPRLGHDFSSVRVHQGGEAAYASRSINARAFTLGNNVVFDSGQYQPQSNEGKRLLGHELIHVIQQSQGVHSYTAADVVQRAEPVTTVTFGALAAKCIIGAITGALFDAGIQAALYAWRERTWRFWRVALNWCTIILSAALGCIAAPISAYILEPWIAARLGSRLGGMAGTLIGKILLFIAKKLGMAIPKGLTGTLLKLNCISPEQSEELGVPVESVS